MSREAYDTESKALVEEAFHKQIASLMISGLKPSEIAKQLNTTTYKISRVLKTDEFKDHLKEVTEVLVATAANTWKSAMQERISDSIKVIDHHLKNNNLEAVKLVMKSVGIEKTEQQIQSGALTIVLPGQSAEKEVISEVE
jgi:hypothetical protein